MKLLAPEMKSFNEKTKKMSKTGDYNGVQEERKKFSQLRKHHGISSWGALLGLSQIPFIMTWFFSVRYMAMNPDLFPKMTDEGFLWFQNLSDYDPFFVLPLSSPP